jgi:glucose/arabinose dehydrogenase
VPCNICLSPDSRHGTLLKLDPKTGEHEIYASGVCNSVGFDWHPVTKQLWFTDNGRDCMGQAGGRNQPAGWVHTGIG